MNDELDHIIECFDRIQKILSEYTGDLDMNVHLSPQSYYALEYIMQKNPAFIGTKDPVGMKVLKIATGFSMIQFEPKAERYWEMEKRISLEGREVSSVIYDDPIIRRPVKKTKKSKEHFNFMEELSKI